MLSGLGKVQWSGCVVLYDICGQKRPQISLCIHSADQCLSSLSGQHVKQKLLYTKICASRRLVFFVLHSLVYLMVDFLITRLICNFEERIRLSERPLDIVLC